MKPLTDATRALFQPVRVTERDRLKVELTRDGSNFIGHFYQESVLGNGRHSWPSHSVRHFVARFPERKVLTQTDYPESYALAGTDNTAALINQVWPRQQLVVEDDAQVILDHFDLVASKEEVGTEVYANYKEHKVVPKHNLEMHPKWTLAPHQQVPLINSMGTDGYGLFMEQGTGKTAVVIARIMNEAKKHFLQTGKPYRAIIVCPNNIRLNWFHEVFKFATRPGKIDVIRGLKMKRLEKFTDLIRIEDDDQHMYHIAVMSYGTLTQDWDMIRLLPWNLGVLDESHYAKTPTAKRTKKCWELRDICESRMVLTGTPITNTMLDLYAQLEFMGEGYSGFKVWDNFRRFYGVFERSEQGFEALVGIQNMPFMQERLTRKTFIVRKKEALPDLPDKVYDIDEVEMETEQARVYDEIAESLCAEIDSYMSDTDQNQLVVNNVLTRLLRLAQITSGFVVFPDQKDEYDNVIAKGESHWLMDEPPKLKALLDLVSQLGEHDKMLVWACFKMDIGRISEGLFDAGVKHAVYFGETSDKDRDQAVWDFNNDPDCKVFVANPAAGGAGLNLLGYDPTHNPDSPYNATHSVYYSQNWSAPARSQSEDRNHRRGTRVQCRITDLCVAQTIDEEIRQRVVEKITNAYKISDIRHILASVRRS